MVLEVGMRFVKTLMSAVTVGMLIVPARWMAAQQRPEGGQYVAGETRILGRVFIFQARPGMVGQFEAGLKRHMAWHRLRHDPWTWETWAVNSGPSAGSYVILATPPWSQLAKWEAKFAGPQAANQAVNVLPYVGFSLNVYWVYQNDISRPAAYGPPTWPMVQLVNFQLKPESELEFVSILGKVHDAMVKTNWQPEQSYFWYQLGVGGDEPQMTLVLPKHTWAEVTAPGGQIAEPGGLFFGVLEAAYGRAEADSLLQRLGKCVVRRWTDVAEKRVDLTYVSPTAKAFLAAQ
jgi:hypothetical protein